MLENFKMERRLFNSLSNCPTALVFPVIFRVVFRVTPKVTLEPAAGVFVRHCTDKEPRAKNFSARRFHAYFTRMAAYSNYEMA
jgi:hypothetical protein